MEGKQQKKPMLYFINSPIKKLLEEYDSKSLHFTFFNGTERNDLNRTFDMFSLYFHIIWEPSGIFYFDLLGCFRLNI